MLEIRFHGRGGQGTVVASVILARALFHNDYYVQTFPSFGVERRGAPVEAYLRLDHDTILVRSNVYTPDHIVVQDRKLFDTAPVMNGLKSNGWIILNAPKSFELPSKCKGFPLARIDAAEIARKHGLGTQTHPIINTAMVGAFARTLKMPSIDALTEAIQAEISVKVSANIDAAKEAYDLVSF
ncbi:MAG: Pyruvate synthase subunit porC [Candidatus Magnetoglobus multicellularis str. Araruama]|uniref:Pyruvate synthase subunit porC n=1 Tax=Candidatus Magnetoglobus multicellularis str. Araruama TaxID=890399 RepID=A0A1V1P6M9_9BACT|nr:MAG: Pyruvate synthase subunit porC [Candidatus Magnetoglobus multicellularis str. Araruama]